MTPGDHDALEALNRRLEHVESTAMLLARTIDERDLGNALSGVAETIAELSNRLDAIINPSSLPI